MRKILTATMIAFTLQGSAQFLTPQTLIQSDVHPGWGFSTDIDLDGDLDIVQSDQLNPSNIRIYYRDGNTFNDVVYNTPAALNTANVAASADIDNDGDIDLINSYGWIENIGGAFTAGHFFSPLHHHGDVAIGDFNNDDSPDVVLSHATNGADNSQLPATVFLNNGSGSFSPSVTIDDYILTAQVADINSDGSDDIYFLYGSGGNITKFIGNGDGTFQTGTTWITGITSNAGLADLNNDGKMDLFSASNPMGPGNSSLKINYGTTPGELGTAMTIPLSFRVSYWYDAYSNQILDYDGDGDLDIMMKPDRRVFWLENHGTTFSENSEVIHRISDAKNLIWTNLNGDSHMDAAETSNELTLYTQESDNKLYSTQFACNGGCYVHNPFDIADMNNDGQPDILSYNDETGIIATETNPFGLVVSHPASNHAPSSTRPRIFIDFNKDGMTDILTSIGVNEFDILLRKDDFHYYPYQRVLENFTMNIGFDGMEFDVNLDGESDLVLLDGTSNRNVYWFDFDAALGWVNQGILAQLGTTDYPGDVHDSFHAGDFNGDGIADISITANTTCHLLIGDGSGGYDSQLVYTSPGFNNMLVNSTSQIGDFNMDGMDEVLFLERSFENATKKFFIIRYDGTNYNPIMAHQFSYDDIFTSNSYTTYCTGDLELDGDVDIIYTFNTQFKLLAHNGIGYPGVSTMNITSPNRITHCSLALMDNDLLPDLVFSGTDDANGLNSWIRYASSNFDSPYRINISAFIDYNGNAMMDQNDEPLTNQQIVMTEGWGSVFTDENGETTFYGLAGDFSATLPFDNNLWTAVTPSSQSATLTTGAPVADMIFAISPLGEQHNVEGIFGYSDDQCGGESGQEFSIVNLGNTIASGEVTYTLDSGFQYIDAIPTPQSVSGNTISWSYADLGYGQSINYFVLAMSPDVSAMGNTATHTLQTRVHDDQGNELNTHEISTSYVIQCSYDPNDIQEQLGWTENGYILPDGQIQYNVRFQNIGNAPAEFVRIENVLSNMHDWSSVMPLASSHDYSVQMDDQGKLNFIFEGINLPPAEFDEPGSHGYITFRIRPIEGLAPGTIIPHQASIFFDLNPAVVTNQVINTIFDCTEITADVPSSACSADGIEVSTDRNDFTMYTWTVNGNSATTGQSASLSLPIEGIADITLEASNPICTISNMSQVEVLPSPAISLISDDMTVCEGPVTLQVEGTGSIVWMLNENAIGQTNTIEVAEGGLYTVALSNNCGIASEQVLVEITGSSAAISITSTNDILCGDDFSILTATASEGLITWMNNGEIIATGEQIMTETAGEISATVEDSAGCGSATSTITITQLQYPTASLNANGPTTFCDGGSVVIDASSNLDNYSFTVNSVEVSSAQITIAMNASVMVAAQNECGLATDAIDVFVQPLPAATITDNPGSQTLTAGMANSYQWYLNGVAINGATSQTYGYSEEGLYSVEVTGNGDCSVMSEQISVIIFGVSTLHSGILRVYPNPVSSTCTLKISQHYIGQDYAIYDALGRQTHIRGKLNTTNLALNLLPLSAGLYTLRLSNGDNLKIVIER